MRRCSAIIFAMLTMLAATAPLAAQSPAFGVGRPPSPEEIRDLGSAIAPDGTGLPEGSGTVAAGREVFAAQCARCHGPRAQGDVGPILVGGQGSLATARPLKTVGSFWPYATTLWDYINRAMPWNAPKSLSADEVYAVTAYMRLGDQAIDPSRKYKVAGWAPVSEEAKAANTPPVWEVVEQWLKARGGRVTPRQASLPTLVGALPNPGYAG